MELCVCVCVWCVCGLFFSGENSQIATDDV
jgi:hypothetical protein